MRTADDPDALLLAFLQSTYDAAATRARWDRSPRTIGRSHRPWLTTAQRRACQRGDAVEFSDDVEEVAVGEEVHREDVGDAAALGRAGLAAASSTSRALASAAAARVGGSTETQWLTT